MRLSLTGLARSIRALAEDVASRPEGGDTDPIDDDFVYRHQPRLSAHFVEELVRNLAELRDHPEKHAEFFAIYVIEEEP